MAETYKVGTRTSPLALKQVEELGNLLRGFYPDIKLEVVGIDTYGDKDKNTPISQIEGTDFFTREVDDALLTGEVDFVVHSAKDLVDNLSPKLIIAAITESIDPFDVLVSKSGLDLEKLPKAARVGTSSLRRKKQLMSYRSDLQIIDIRGNIEERLNLLDSGEAPKLDGIVIAAAGLIRLGLEARITQKISFDILEPHPLQGALAVVTKVENKELIKMFSKIDKRETICNEK